MPPSLPSYGWLNTLKATQLQEFAFAVGVASAGPKDLVAQGIRDALIDVRGKPIPWATEHKPRGRKQKGMTERILMQPIADIVASAQAEGNLLLNNGIGNRQISILSIDMGIRTLAYAHLTLPTASLSNPTTLAQAQHPTLSAWRTVNIAPRPGIRAEFLSQPTASVSLALDNNRESFSPILYASHAYSLISSLLSPQRAHLSSSNPLPPTISPPLPPLDPPPTHLIIERQRFRTAGSAAVTDWALRVGVFEGMLHAVAETLKRERGLELGVEGVDPKRVVGFWLRDQVKPGVGDEIDGESKGRKGERKQWKKAKEVKKMKIEVVRQWLNELEHRGTEQGQTAGKRFLESVHPKAQSVVDAYLAQFKGRAERKKALEALEAAQAKTKQETATGVGTDEEVGQGQLLKLDDLADSLLQGMAWWKWQQNRAKAAGLVGDGEGDEDSEALIAERRAVLKDLGIKGVDNIWRKKGTPGQKKSRAKTKKSP